MGADRGAPVRRVAELLSGLCKAHVAAICDAPRRRRPPPRHMGLKRLPVVEAERLGRVLAPRVAIASLQPFGEPVGVFEARVAWQRSDGAALERVVANGEFGRHPALDVVVGDAEPPVTARHRIDCRLSDSQGDGQRLALSPVFAAEVKLLSTTREHQGHLVGSAMFECGGERDRSLKLEVEVARGLAKRPRIDGSAEVETHPPGRVNRLRDDRRSVLVGLPVRQRRYDAAEQ